MYRSLAIPSTSPCNAALSTNTTTPLLFRVVTQQYGKGIVQYGERQGTSFPGTGNGGSFYDICDTNGVIYVEVDLSCPACIGCGVDTLDGYTGTTITSAATTTSFSATYRRYKELER